MLTIRADGRTRVRPGLGGPALHRFWCRRRGFAAAAGSATRPRPTAPNAMVAMASSTAPSLPDRGNVRTPPPDT